MFLCSRQLAISRLKYSSNAEAFELTLSAGSAE